LEDEIISSFAPESMEEFKHLHEEILTKSDLKNFYDRLKIL
jgi:hypothetical protein